MSDRAQQSFFPQFGGDWTEQKLSVLRQYLRAYTRVMSKQKFRTIYVDAFAGAGAREEEDADGRQFIEGSAKIALEVSAPTFDELVFIEQERNYVDSLRELISDSQADDHARVEQADANERLPKEVQKLAEPDRAVVFVDPFGTEVRWTTVASLMGYHGVDAWILFPVGTICRMMPVLRQPPNAKTQEKLDSIFGTPAWRDLYDQPQLFGEAGRLSKSAGVDKIVALYRTQLEAEFTAVADRSVSLVNSRNSRLYELLFVMTNQSSRAQKAALGIADHIMKITS